MKNGKEQDYELNAPVFKLGVEENVFSKNLNQTDEIIGLHNIDVRNSNKYLENTYAKNKYDYDTTYNKMSYNQQDYISDLIADNKKELEYLELKQKERNLEIKNRQDNIKILQNQRKELKKQKLEREKLYSSLKENDIGLTKICNTFSNNNLTPSLTFSKSEFEPLIKKKQAQQVNQYELERIKNERRANLFYGEDDSDEAREYFENKKLKKEKLNILENQLLKDYSPIFSKNTMLNTENLAEMDFEKSKKNGDEIREKLEEKSIDKYKSDLNLLLRAFQQVMRILKEDFSLSDDEKAIIAEIIKYNIFSELSFSYFKTKNFISDYINDRSEKVQSYFRVFELLERIPDYELKQMVEDFLSGSEITAKIASIIIGDDASGLLKFSAKNADMNALYLKEATVYNTADELPEIYKNFLKDKINSQHLSEDTSGILFDSNSQVSKRLINNNDFREVVLNQITPEIFYLFKSYKNDIEIQYKNGIEFTYGNFKYAIRKADIINLKIDIFGNVSGDLVDTTDYNDPINDLKIVKVGYELQKENKIVPKFVIIHFSIPIEKL